MIRGLGFIGIEGIKLAIANAEVIWEEKMSFGG